MRTNMRISEINIFPVKSLKAIPLRQTAVEKRGLQYDRRWMVVDSKGMFLTQREFPRMAAITVELLETGLRISSEGFEDLRVPLEPNDTTKVAVSVWQKHCDAFAVGDEADEWFSDVLGSRCRIVYLPEAGERQEPLRPLLTRDGDPVSFADGYPLLLTTEDSLADLNEKLGDSIPMSRFRPNVVVSGSEAFAEDRWKRIRIGETIFRVVKPCARCVITTIDQASGIAAGTEPLRTLAELRTAGEVFPDNFESFGLRQNAIVFGENLVAENAGKMIAVGDQVEIIEFRD